jgi:ferredoxin
MRYTIDFGIATRKSRFDLANKEIAPMATMITEECINCGACEPECPNEAISEGEDIYVIDPNLCTECVGFHDYEACQAVCPVECCIPDPNNVESEEVLLERARKLHPDKEFPALADLPANLSRFRK